MLIHYVQHEDVSKMFDFDSDLVFTNIRPYAGKIAKFVGGEMVSTWWRIWL